MIYGRKGLEPLAMPMAAWLAWLESASSMWSAMSIPATAPGEGEDRADAHAEFFEGELRIGEQWAYSSCGFHSGCSAWYSIEPGANSDLGRPASAAASRALITASALRRVVSGSKRGHRKILKPLFVI